MSTQTPQDPPEQDASLWIDPRVSLACDLQESCPDPATLDAPALRRLIADYRHRMRLILDVCHDYAGVDAAKSATEEVQAAQPVDQALAGAIMAELPQPVPDAFRAVAEFLATPETSGDAAHIVLRWLRRAAAAGLTARQRKLLGQALADAVAWRENPDYCGGCAKQSPERCPVHAADKALADAYPALAHELGIELAERAC
jgi:hypothetical protein